MKKLVFACCGIVTLLVLWSATAQESGFKIIVNSANPVDQISKTDASNFLLKRKTRWDSSGLDASPVDLDGSSPVREAFSKEVHGRSVSSIKNYWQRQIFSGREVPPVEMGSDGEVVAFVRSQAGAIGYVSSNARLDGVKAVRLIE